MLSFVVEGVPAERVVQRLADNGVLAMGNASSRVLDVIGVNDIGGAVTIGLRTTPRRPKWTSWFAPSASLG